MRSHMRKELSAPGLLSLVRHRFSRLKDPLTGKTHYPLVECLMSGLSIFGLKYPSLLQFDRSSHTEPTRHNLERLYQIKAVPSDTYMRERLDKVNAIGLGSSLKAVFSAIQRSHLLQGYDFMGSYLVPIDGTGVFYSKTIHCEHCCVRHHRNGEVSYYHQALVATLVHPESHIVLPLNCESIRQQDGVVKNDCELNAAKRLIARLRHQHPKLPMTLVEDALYANGPHIRLLRAYNMRHITVVKPKNHQWLFDWVKASETQTLSMTRQGKLHQFSWVNDVPLSDASDDVRVNFLDYWETDKKGKVHHWTWVTDFVLTKASVYRIMRGGRARWRIENETFNTLKNQGYHFEHNFGHGYEQLTDVFIRLMLLAFLIDQAQQLACPIFQRAWRNIYCAKVFWEHLRAYFFTCQLADWQMLYTCLLEAPRMIPYLDSS